MNGYRHAQFGYEIGIVYADDFVSVRSPEQAEAALEEVKRWSIERRFDASPRENTHRRQSGKELSGFLGYSCSRNCFRVRRVLSQDVELSGDLRTSARCANR